MNRKKIIDAIIEKRGRNWSTEDALRHALKYLSDTNLISFAQDLEINTDAILLEDVVRS